MTGVLVDALALARATAAPGTTMNGAKLYFYLTGGLTPANSYTTSALNVANANPVVASSGGLFPPIYLDPAITYRVKLTTSGGTPIQDIDPYNTLTTTADLNFIQFGTGAVIRTAQSKMRERVSAADFRLGSDPDDTLSVQRAIDSFGAYAGVVEIDGLTVSDTIDIEGQAVTLRSRGWGVSNVTQKLGFLKWGGLAGIPMLRLKGGTGAGVEMVRLIGNSAAKPSALLELTQGSASNINNLIRKVWFGALYAFDTDDAIQADVGLLVSGASDGDTNSFEDLHFFKMTIGLSITNPGASATLLKTFNAQTCGTGISTIASIVGVNVGIYSSTVTDMAVLGPSTVDIRGFSSEGSSRMAVLSGTTPRLRVDGGVWGVGTSGGPSTINADGYWIDRTDTASNSTLVLKNFQLANSNSPYTGPVPKIRLNRPTPGINSATNEFDNTLGIWNINLDPGAIVGSQDTKPIRFNPSEFSGQEFSLRSEWLGSFDRVADWTFRPGVTHRAGEFALFGGPHYVRKLLKPVGAAVVALVGAGATTYGYRITALTYGGETDATTVVTCTNAATLDSTHKNRVSWLPVQGAYAYKIYGRTSGSELLMKTIDDAYLHPGAPAQLIAPPYWDDDGSLTPSGALPTVNTTGGALIEGGLCQLTETGITAHAGGTQAAAFQLTTYRSQISTCATAADSVRLKPAIVGASVVVRNDGANAAQLFGYGTDTLDAAATATGISLAAAATYRAECFVAGAWRS